MDSPALRSRAPLALSPFVAPAAWLACLALASPAVAAPLPSGVPSGVPSADPSGSAVTTPSPTQDPAAKDAKKNEKWKAWPALEKADQRRIKRELDKLAKARTDEMVESAIEELKALGAPAAPELAEAVEKEKDEKARGRLLEVLDSIVDDRASRLLGEYFASRSVELRRWSLTRVARTSDAEMRTPAEAALATIEKRAEKDRDEAEHDAAAMCALSTGSTKGLARARTIADKRWSEHAELLRQSLERVRGDEATDALLGEVAGGDRAKRVVALRLLAGCGTERAIGKIKGLLDSSDNSLRVETINALRGIVDGDPPLPRLSAFEAVERAAKWKGRV